MCCCLRGWLLLTLDTKARSFVLENLFLGISVVELPIIEAPVSQTVPLSARLCVERNSIVL